MRIEIPMLPPRELNPNWHGHWAKKARAVKSYRDTVCLYALSAGVWGEVVFQKVEVSITFIIRDRRGIKDPDNALASLKSAIDGCVDAGLIPDDSDEHLSYRLPIMYEINKEKAPMTILEFKEVK